MADQPLSRVFNIRCPGTRRYHRRQRRQQAFCEIHKAESFEDFRAALNLFASAEGWPINLTIRRWTLCWTSSFKQDDDFHKLLDQLSQACYSKAPLQDLEVFRSMLLAQLRSSKRIGKYCLQRRSM